MKNENEVVSQIEIETSTDTPEQVRDAMMRGGVEIDEAPDSEQPEEAAAEEEEEKAGTDDEEEAEEGEETEDDDEESESEEEEKEPPKATKKKAAPAEGEADEKTKGKPPVKGGPPMVPRARLNEEIRRRKDAEARAEARSTTPAEETTVVPDKPNTQSGTWCGRAKPTLAQFEADIDKFPDPHAAFSDAIGEWHADERDAKREHQSAVARAAQEQAERTKGFKAAEKETLKRRPDYGDIVGRSTMEVSNVMEDFFYDSKIGSDVLLYLVENPDETEKIRGIRTVRGQVKALEALEKEILAEIGGEESEEEAAEDDDAEGEQPTRKPGPPSKRVPPTKKVAASKAPLPPGRIKTQSGAPKSLQELAGPADRQGIDIDFNPEYERVYTARQRKSI